jgi:hypothetical protein
LYDCEQQIYVQGRSARGAHMYWSRAKTVGVHYIGAMCAW